MVRVVQGNMYEVWATLSGLMRLEDNLRLARFRSAADGASEQGHGTQAAGPADGSGSSMQQPQQHNRQEQQPAISATSGTQATSVNLSTSTTGAGSIDSALAAPAVLPHPGSSNSSTANCCYFHDLRSEPLTDFPVASPAGGFDMVVTLQHQEVKLVELHSKGVRLPQQRSVDVSLKLQLQVCSKEMHETMTTVCFKVAELTAAVTEVEASGQPQSSSSSANAGTGSCCCWVGVGEHLAMETKPFVSCMQFTLFAQTGDGSDSHDWLIGSLLLGESAVETSGTQKALVAQSANGTAGAMLQAWLNPQAQMKVERTTQTYPVPGAFVAHSDTVLATMSSTPVPVKAKYPRWSHPVTACISRFPAATLTCNQEECFASLSTNPLLEEKHDVILKCPLPPPTLPTLAIKMAMTAEVGLIKYPFRDHGMVGNVRNYVVIKDADVDMANLGYGLSVDVGRRTAQNVLGPCQLHI